MEDTHRAKRHGVFHEVNNVLILVLMEDTHREPSRLERKVIIVLILVLMEDTHRVESMVYIVELQKCLNPCSNGRYSQR